MRGAGGPVRRGVLLRAKLQLRRFQHELGGHQHLHHAVVQFARHPQPLVLLRTNHPLRQAPQLRAQNPVVADVERQSGRPIRIMAMTAIVYIRTWVSRMLVCAWASML